MCDVIQSSKLWPFWLPWQVKNTFGYQNFDKSCQLATNRIKKKKEKKNVKHLPILGQIIKWTDAGNAPVFLFSPKYV